MIYTVDRVQFDVNEELLFFEFYNRSKDNNDFVRRKYNALSKIPNTRTIGVNYDDNGHEIIVWEEGKSTAFYWGEYTEWFVLKNKEAKMNSPFKSKKLGAATENVGDPFVHEILNYIHNVNFSSDDNGLGITKKALDNEATYGFDFDLFDDKNKTIIEFLNNETKEKGKNPIDNIHAHPMRYAWISNEEQKKFAEKQKIENPNWENPRKKDNRQKYISLWSASQKLNGELYLVNYNKLDKKEDLSVIEVIELDEEMGIMYDISYKITFKQLVTWLIKMNSDPLAAKAYLAGFEKEVRDTVFWENYYQNQATYPSPKRSHIGKNYK
ncbi:hypothetical protein M3182_04550 [Mesobacillus maritimus]|uniref:hypothetical protein n=1 Tax=Mesobacillus maritimus TaxID=1643336 RepID=UPI00203CBF79|nr:hypothetical protein [Mesobacillus maritimus]MCM3585016.1 hypothetical protein [Mesobacillus maritimus]